MQEDYLHYLWKFQKWNGLSLCTTEGFSIKVINVGSHNLLSGPDFFNSRMIIGEQEWAGNVEIHIKASDWYRHGHDLDEAYNNVILHVVWEHDAEVYRKNKEVVAVVALKEFVQKEALSRYEHLLKKDKKWINCENDFPALDDFLVQTWLERLFVERLEQKAVLIETLLKSSSGNWEEVFFKMLAKNFGLNINGDAFLSTAGSIPFSVARKSMSDRKKFEALLFGQSGLLEGACEEPWFKLLQKEYDFLKRKYDLQKAEISVRHFRLRPDNFPEIRLSQLAGIYEDKTALFSEISKAGKMKQLQKILQAEAGEFWKSHYTFTKTHDYRRKPVSESFIDLLIINTIIPIRFLFDKKVGASNQEEKLLEFMEEISAETNSVVKNFNALRPDTAKTALQSQALLQMKKEYCDKNRCLHCSIGLKILKDPR